MDDWAEKFVLGLFLFILAGGLLLAFFVYFTKTTRQILSVEFVSKGE